MKTVRKTTSSGDFESMPVTFLDADGDSSKRCALVERAGTLDFAIVKGMPVFVR
jgi:hypothetical protein